ncbi:MAG TPA: hypothetical protein PLW81_11270 [Thiobacillaceae bacterium]|nr:hypothetical protein [Thiobacillaceae bacterium]
MKRSPFALTSLLLLALSVAFSGSAWSASAADTTKAQELRQAKKVAKSAKRKTSRKTSASRKSVQPAARPVVAKADQQSPAPASGLNAPALLPPLAIPTLTLTTQLSETPPVQPVVLPAAQPVTLLPTQSPARPATASGNRPMPAPPKRQPAVKPAETAKPAVHGNPYMAHPQQVNQPLTDIGKALDEINVGMPSLLSLPSLPSLFSLPSLPEGLSVLPVIKTVYPTGEKPLVIVTFKCPTELVGITPLPTKALHDLVTWGMDSINSTNLLAFNMQQVCQ